MKIGKWKISDAHFKSFQHFVSFPIHLKTDVYVHNPDLNKFIEWNCSIMRVISVIFVRAINLLGPVFFKNEVGA
jgi:hypothetical protein